jgi:hypothetical protein
MKKLSNFSYLMACSGALAPAKSALARQIMPPAGAGQ